MTTSTATIDWPTSRAHRGIAAVVSTAMHFLLVWLCLVTPSGGDRLPLFNDKNTVVLGQPSVEPTTSTLFFIPADNSGDAQLHGTPSEEIASDASELLSTQSLQSLSEPTMSVEALPDGMTPIGTDSDQIATPRAAYLSQIQARIERAWDHPVAVMAEPFKCRVKIQQTPQGEVQSLSLKDCHGDPAWQQSLMRAIRNAAPFPAAPDEQSFVAELTLDFETEPVSLAGLFKLLAALPAKAMPPIDQGMRARPKIN